MNSDSVKINSDIPAHGGVSQCQNSLDSDSDTPPGVAAPKGVVRILLSKAASDALTAAGEGAFAIVGKATSPDDPSRWVIHLAPVEWETAVAACNVLLGTHRAIRRKK